jgi:hypothetical protein
MGNLSLTFLPVLGGFLFLYYSHFTKFYCRRRSGYTLFFLSCLTGLALLSLSHVLGILTKSLLPPVFDWVQTVTPDEDGYTGTYIGSIPASAVLVGLTNSFSHIYGGYRTDDKNIEDIKSQKVAKSEGTDLEVFLDEALSRAKLVIATLESNHSYIGFVTSNLDPLGRQYIRILKVASGYRSLLDRNLEIKTNYNPVIKGVSKFRSNDEEIEVEKPKQLEKVKLDDFNVVIPVGEIDSISYFNRGVEEFFEDDVPSVDHPDPSNIDAI